MAICNQYLYPGAGIHGRKLKRGRIFSTNRRYDATSYPSRAGSVAAGRSEVDMTWSKKFQFNPPDLGLSLQNINVNDSTVEQDGGNVPSGFGLGLAEQRLSLFFNREQEVYRHTANGEAAFGVPWRDIGVQKDVYDIYSVLLGASSAADYEAALGGGNINASGADDTVDVVSSTVQSIGNLTRSFFDLAGGGVANFLFTPVAVVYNTNLVVYGNVTSMAFNFTKFNHQLVPVFANIDLTLQIVNVAGSTPPPTSGMGGSLYSSTTASGASSTTQAPASASRTGTSFR